jgi:hypothetical protein
MSFCLVILLSVILLSVILKSVILLIVILLIVILLNAVESFRLDERPNIKRLQMTS